MAQNFYYSLEPFVSLTLGVPERALSDMALAAKTVESMGLLLGADIKDKIVSDRVDGPAYKDRASGAAVRGFRYKRRVTPGWTSDDRIVDTENHLIVAVALNGRVALHFSDVRLRGSVRGNLSADVHKDLPLSWLFLVPRGLMAAAFLQGGETRTLWLAGTHRRNALKADSKILSGPDLDYALDPFEDQSFFWSAARSHQAKLSVVIGVSPSSSRVWTRKASTFADFVGASVTVLTGLEGAKQPLDDPFRYLASPVTTIKPNAVHSAFDLSIMPDELAAEIEGDPDEAAATSTLVYEANLAVKPDAGESPSFSVDAIRNGQSLGSFHVGVAIDKNGKVSFKTDAIKASRGNADMLRTLATQVSRGQGVNIRYDTGHSVSNGLVFVMRNRRVSFGGYEGYDFSGFDISKEKPSSLDRIGREDSLFCWVQRNLRGWLACDDGSMEKADFIHIDETGTPTLSLIHVKGAHSTAAGRRISVAAYEVVTGQAVKNLLWLNRDDLAAGLKVSARASNYFWHNGAAARQDVFVRRLEGLPANHRTRVVVLQPHVSMAKMAGIKPGGNAERLRLDQLNTLLAGAERTCSGLSAAFRVMCSA